MNRTVEAREGQRILELCEENLIPLETRCGGNCACSSCRVIVLGGDDHLSPQEDDELTQLEEAEASTASTRLACQARIHGDVDIEIPGLR
jgi:adenylate cyclase